MTALDERPDRAPDAALGSRLTGREFQVLRLIALGRSDGGIAAELFLTRSTVHSHLRRIFARLGAHTRANAVAIAYHRRILLLPGEERRPPLPDFTQADEPVGVSVVAQALLVREWAASGRARAVRVASGLSLVVVGASCGVSGTAVARWESGRSTPRGAFLEAYYRALREMAAAAVDAPGLPAAGIAPQAARPTAGRRAVFAGSPSLGEADGA